MRLTRRRFLAISAVALATPSVAAPVQRFTGQALGAKVTLTLAHPDAPRIAARAMDEIARLERIFSLHRESDLTRLNARARLDAPPFEMLECLSLCSRVHAATGGLFDPTVQPLWALHAESHARGGPPDAASISAALARTGWSAVRFDEGSVRLRPGMALTLNGVAQGYIADRVAALLAAEGLSDLLVDTGELHALGSAPDGGAWPVTLATGERAPLRDRSLASSAPQGTVFDAAGSAGHILDPRTGRPAGTAWRLVSVSSPAAALADALSTAFCLMSRAEMESTLAAFPEARLAGLS